MPAAGQHGEWDLPINAGSDLQVLARTINRVHDDFVATGRSDARLRPVVLESWKRCLSTGLDPEHTAAPMELLDDALLAAQSEHPLFAAMPTIRRLLVDTAVDAGLLVAVSDAAGRLLWVEGSPQLRSRAESIAFAPGANWSESSAGTNAPGTALALDRPVQIFGAEHLSRPVTPWSCSAAPIHDPASGAVLGVLDLTGGPDVAGPRGMAIVRATVAAVESELLLERLLREQQVDHSGGGRVGLRASRPTPAGRTAGLQVLGRRGALLYCGSTGGESRSTGVAAIELGQRHSEIVLLLTEARDGLSAEELAVRLSEAELSPVTVRAELSRLRAVLPMAMGSRPYRLLSPVRTDVDDVREALRSRRLRAAVGGYPGPVLPRSWAPGVVRIRDEMHHELRAALIAGGDPDALLSFADTEHGRDDLAVWQAALAALPAESPRLAQVESHCADLSIRLA